MRSTIVATLVGVAALTGAAVDQVERLRARVRLIHLRHHLQTRALLTGPQLAAYHAARWSASR